MAKWVHPDILDNGISAIKANANKQVLLKAYVPGDSYATVNGVNKLAEVAMVSGDYTLGNGSGSSRTLTTAAGKSATASASSGVSPDLHIAFVDTANSKVLWVTATSNVSVTAGDTVNFPVLVYTADQPPGAMSAMSQYADEVAAGRGATLESAQRLVVASLVSGAGRSPRLGNVLTCGFLGRFMTAATSGNPHTSQMQFALEADFDAVRLIIPNSVTSSLTGVQAIISAAAQAGAAGSATAIDPTTAGGAWTTVTFAGSSTVTLAAGTSVDAVSWTASDWIRCSSLARSDGGAQPLLTVRILIPGTNANRPAWYFGGLTDWETEAIVAGRIRRFRSQANTDGVNTPANFTGSSIVNYNCTPVYVQYLSRKSGVTVMVVGNSIYEGSGADSRRGWQFIGRDAVSTPARPIELCTVSIAGANSATWLARLRAVISTVNPDYVVLAGGYEVNDQATPMAGTGQAISRYNCQQALKVCTDNMAIPIVATGCPSNESAKALGTGDSLRRAINADVRALGTSRAWMDFDALMAGSAVASGQIEFNPAYTTDGLHPNTVGHGVLASGAFTPMLQQIVTANFAGT